MNFPFKFLIVILMGLGYNVLGQTGNSELKDCIPATLPHTSDSTVIKKALDSLYNKAVGRWQMIKIDHDPLLPYTPEQLVEITINSKGSITIVQSDKLPILCNLRIVSRKVYIRFTICEEGRQFFRFPKSRRGVFEGGIRVCDDIMIIHDFASGGFGYIFKRIK